MRILFCNKYNYAFSGTEMYLFEVMELLRAQGHEVALFSMRDPRGQPTQYDAHFIPHVDFKSSPGFWHRARQLPRAIYSSEARQKIRGMIREFRPDVAHVRNIYHHLTPSILWELKTQHVPVIYHLNDFKLLCPSYNLVSHGEACEACKGGAFWHAPQQKCYPGLAALPEVPDCVVIALPREGVEAAVEDCAARGVGGVVIYASGYAETGIEKRKAQQARLTAIASAANMRIVGPNCFGIANNLTRALKGCS